MDFQYIPEVGSKVLAAKAPTMKPAQVQPACSNFPSPVIRKTNPKGRFPREICLFS